MTYELIVTEGGGRERYRETYADRELADDGFGYALRTHRDCEVVLKQGASVLASASPVGGSARPYRPGSVADLR